MQDIDLPTYLANLLAVARADGTLLPKELAVVEEVRKRIGATKTDAANASKIAEGEGYVITSTGRFSDRVRNLEDMISVALIDDSLAETEKALIADFSQRIDITQKQLDRIIHEVQARPAANSASCPQCHQSVDSAAKFCPNCGVTLGNTQQDGAINLAFTIPSNGYAIEFCESTAANFSAALGLAKGAPTFQSCLRARKTWYLAAWPTEAFAEATATAEALAGVKNKKVYIDAKETPWGEVFGFCFCAQQRQSAYRPVDYCFGVDEKRLNLWGCRMARMDWIEWAEWMTYGSFKSIGTLKKQVVWVFDKVRICHELNTQLHLFRFCPHVRRDLIAAVIEALPDEISVTPSGPWKYRENYEETPGSIKIVEREGDGGIEYTREFYANGVAPRGLGAAKEILVEAFRRAGITDASPEQLAG